MADQEQCARIRYVDRSPRGLRAAPMELLEVSCGGGDAVSQLLRSGHDSGGNGLSLSGDDAKVVEGDRFSDADCQVSRNLSS